MPADYSHVHVDPLVISTLESSTYLSLARRDQFDFGVLKHHRMTGGILFGPPGTGKTLVAQAVAKKSGFRMLSISSGDIFQKHWGEDEKMIRAAFALARRLHPCILFIDEADGLFGVRRDDDKRHARSMLSEVLREWDGVSPEGKRNNPFVLLATNLPWDIDPAVLRRAPVRIMMSMPSQDHRKEILKILLGNETLADDLSVDVVASLTRSFSGSDLKSLCVAAAVNCVREQVPNKNGVYANTRTIRRRHFDLALRYIRPSGSDKSVLKKHEAFQKNGL